MAHDQLCIDQDVCTEDECGNTTVDQFHSAAIREERRHEAENDQDPQATEEIRHPGREVVLGLTRKDCQGDENGRGYDECFQYNLRLVEGDNDGDGVSLERGESAQKQQVCWVGFPFPEGQEHEADRPKEGNPHHPCVGLNPVLVASAPVRD